MKTIISYNSVKSCEFGCSSSDLETIKSLAYEVITSETYHTIECNTATQLADLHRILLPAMIRSTYELCVLSHWFYVVAKLPCSYGTSDAIATFVESLKAEEQWRDLTTPTDYALQDFRRRMLPYFNVDSKEWRASCQIAKNLDYPSELTEETTTEETTTEEPQVRKKKHTKKRRAKSADRSKKPANEKKKALVASSAGDLIIEPEDWNPEQAIDIITVHTKNNNFLAIDILPITEYKKTEQLAKMVTILFDMGMDRLAVRMFYYSMLNPKYCDIFRYRDLMNTVMQVANRQTMHVLQYAMYYSMYAARHEETIMFSQVNPQYRVLYTLEEANKFPIFKDAAFKANPYIQQLTDDTNIRNCIPFYLHGQRTIVDQCTFMRRFAIATGDIFTGFDLEEIGAAVTGSILIPCVHRSPLERLYTGCSRKYNRTHYNKDGPDHTIYSNPYMTTELQTQEDHDFFDYLEQYYPSYVSLNDQDFEENVMCVTRAVQPETTTLVEYEDNTPAAVPDDHDILWCSPSEIKKGVNFNQLADIDCSITTESHEDFKAAALKLYRHIQERCKNRGVVYITEVRTISSIKYKIHGPGMCRPMDVFRVPYGPEKMVKKFHVQFVRQFYNGKLRMFRSCITSLLSGVSDTYRWFSCNKVPIDVILKYAQRGLSTILNSKERFASSAFLENDDRWGRAIKAMRVSCAAIYRPVTINHPFFVPDSYNCGIRMGLRSFGKNYADCVAIYPDIPEDQAEFQCKTNSTVLMPKYSMIDAYCASLGRDVAAQHTEF